jgi:hypothetical protein
MEAPFIKRRVIAILKAKAWGIGSIELLHFLSVAATLSQSCLASSGFAEVNVAVPAHYNGLRV